MVMEFIVDEALIKVNNEYVWLWVAIEPIDSKIGAPSFITKFSILYPIGLVTFLA